MSICIQTGAESQRVLTRQAEFRRQLDTLSSWQERARKIDERLKQTTEALATRNEELLALRGDFNALTLDLWNAFARSLGCENPVGAIARGKARQRSPARRVILLAVTTILVLVIVWCQINGPSLWTVSFCLAGPFALYAMIAGPAKPVARARKVLEILRHEQEPFWLTGGAIALSNLSTIPPSGAQWWMAGRLCFVFVRGVNTRFFIDGHTRELIWENASPSSSSSTQGNDLTGRTAAEILWRLFLTDDRYSQLVSGFSSLSSLDRELTFLQSLKTEADQAVAEQPKRIRP
jgi:hypothetical protein